MAQSLADSYAASLDPRVIAQVTGAIYAYMQTVESEAITGAITQSIHNSRLLLANKIAIGNQSLQPLILSACTFASLNGMTGLATTDTQASNAVAALWNLWSDV